MPTCSDLRAAPFATKNAPSKSLKFSKPLSPEIFTTNASLSPPLHRANSEVVVGKSWDRVCPVTYAAPVGSRAMVIIDGWTLIHGLHTALTPSSALPPRYVE